MTLVLKPHKIYITDKRFINVPEDFRVLNLEEKDIMKV